MSESKDLQRAKDLFLNNMYQQQSKLVNHLIDENIISLEGTPNLEVLEWYSVNSWLADTLLEQGETVIEFMGNYWWGRTTTGSNAWEDHVILEIYDNWKESIK